MFNNGFTCQWGYEEGTSTGKITFPTSFNTTKYSALATAWANAEQLPRVKFPTIEVTEFTKTTMQVYREGRWGFLWFALGS